MQLDRENDGRGGRLRLIAALSLVAWACLVVAFLLDSTTRATGLVFIVANMAALAALGVGIGGAHRSRATYVFLTLDVLMLLLTVFAFVRFAIGD